MGRLHGGEEVLAKVNAARVDKDDAPLQRIVVTACGFTDNQARTRECLADVWLTRAVHSAHWWFRLCLGQGAMHCDSVAGVYG